MSLFIFSLKFHKTLRLCQCPCNRLSGSQYSRYNSPLRRRSPLALLFSTHPTLHLKTHVETTLIKQWKEENCQWLQTTQRLLWITLKFCMQTSSQLLSTTSTVRSLHYTSDFFWNTDKLNNFILRRQSCCLRR